MPKQYRATNDQWETIEEFAEDLNSGPACLLELRDRVLCQEACIKDLYEQLDGLKQRLDGHFRRIKELEGNPISKPTPKNLQIRSSLVNRVAIAISGNEDSAAWDDEHIHWAPEARAAIIEVAAWLSQKGGTSANAWSQVLKGEANS